MCVRGKMDRGNNRSEPRARRGRPALARSPAAQQMPPSGSHGSEVAWIPPGPRLYDTAYVLFVCMYPPCPPGAFLLAMRASGMLPVDGSNRSPPVPGPQYLRRPVRQALAQSGTTLAARAAARAADEGSDDGSDAGSDDDSDDSTATGTRACTAPARTAAAGTRACKAHAATLTGCCPQSRSSTHRAAGSASRTLTTACTRAHSAQGPGTCCPFPCTACSRVYCRQRCRQIGRLWGRAAGAGHGPQ